MRTNDDLQAFCNTDNFFGNKVLSMVLILYCHHQLKDWKFLMLVAFNLWEFGKNSKDHQTQISFCSNGLIKVTHSSSTKFISLFELLEKSE